MELEFNDVWTATLDGTFSNNGLTPRFVASTGGTATVRPPKFSPALGTRK